jgi:hypothetical protein
MLMKIQFDTWKAEFKPRVYEDTGAWCDGHEDANRADMANWCECEFLYTTDLTELEDDEEIDPEHSLSLAIKENRVWTWDNAGIRSGVTTDRSELITTAKAWTEQTEVTD